MPWGFHGTITRSDKAIVISKSSRGTYRYGTRWRDTIWVHSILDEVNSMLEYCRNESTKKKEASLVAK